MSIIIRPVLHERKSMSDPLPELAVVIVNYNTRDLLHACLMALQGSTIPLEIVVVDNHSQDGSAAMVAHDFPAVRLLALEENTWFCGGNNRGIAAAQAPYVLMLNPDTEIAPEACERMLTVLKANPHLAGVTGRLVYPTVKVQQTCSRLPTFADLLIEHSLLRLIRPLTEQRRRTRWYSDWPRHTDQDVEVAPGSCVLLRRADAPLNGDLRLYFPEEDLAKRLQRPFRFVAAAHIVHHEKASTRSWMATHVYFADLLIYTRKHHGRLAAGLLWLFSRPLYGLMWLAAQGRIHSSKTRSSNT